MKEIRGMGLRYAMKAFLQTGLYILNMREKGRQIDTNNKRPEGLMTGALLDLGPRNVSCLHNNQCERFRLW